MRKTFIIMIICFGCCLTTSPASAEGWNLGFKLAYVDPDNVGASSSDNAGLVLGYDWVKSYGVFGVESDFTTSFIDGRINDQDFSSDTLGVHATYKTLGPSKGLGIYLKIKAGAQYYDLDDNAPQSKDDLAASIGLGFGVDMGTMAFEVDYTAIKDLQMVSLVVLF